LAHIRHLQLAVGAPVNYKINSPWRRSVGDISRV
jgi:hypothetical protein